MIPTLYYSPGSCSLAPHIILEEIGSPFHLSLKSTSDGTTKSAEYMQINPKGRVPVLEANGTVLTETPAILIALAKSNPAAKLLPPSDDALVRCVEWCNWLSGSVHAVAIRQIWRPETFLWDPERFSEITSKGMDNLRLAYEMIDMRLKNRQWAIEEQFTIVDAYLLVFYRWGNRLALDMRTDYPAWTLQTLKMAERGSVKRALATEQISIWA